MPCFLRVNHLLQDQAVGGGAEGGFFVVGRVFEQGFDLVEAGLTLGGFHGGTGEEANHFIEEAISGKGHAVAGVGDLVIGAGEGATVVGVFAFVAAFGGEGLEVVLAEKEVEGVGEDIRVELAREVPGAVGQEGWKDGREAEVVGVGLAGGRKAGVEVLCHFLTGEDADVGGEFGVESGNPVVGIHGEVIRGIEMGDLPESVDAGIGAAGAVETDFFPGSISHGGLDEILDSVSVGL